MKVKLSYIDRESLSTEEIEHNAKAIFGDSVSVQLLPEANTTREFIRHAIRLDVTGKQLSSFFDDETEIYNQKITAIKQDFIAEVKDLLDEIIDGNKTAWT